MAIVNMMVSVAGAKHAWYVAGRLAEIACMDSTISSAEKLLELKCDAICKVDENACILEHSPRLPALFLLPPGSDRCGKNLLEHIRDLDARDKLQKILADLDPEVTSLDPSVFFGTMQDASAAPLDVEVLIVPCPGCGVSRGRKFLLGINDITDRSGAKDCFVEGAPQMPEDAAMPEADSHLQYGIGAPCRTSEPSRVQMDCKETKICNLPKHRRESSDQDALHTRTIQPHFPGCHKSLEFRPFPTRRKFGESLSTIPPAAIQTFLTPILIQPFPQITDFFFPTVQKHHRTREKFRFSRSCACGIYCGSPGAIAANSMLQSERCIGFFLYTVPAN